MFTRLTPALVAITIAAAVSARADTQLSLNTLGIVNQTGGTNVISPPSLAVDGNTGTYSETPDTTNSFWEVELPRKYKISRIDLVAPSDAPNNLVLRIFDLRDRTLFKATVSGVIGGGTWTTNLATPVDGRVIRFGLENGGTNGIGDRRTMISEVNVFGDVSLLYGPTSYGGNVAAVEQTSTNSTFEAGRALDGNASTYIETLDATNGYWIVNFNTDRPIQHVEVINRSDAANATRMQGLTLRILDNLSNSVASGVIPATLASNNWVFTPSGGTIGRYVKIGLENDDTNGQGNRIVSFADVSVYAGTNFAVGKDSFMTRSVETLLPVSNINDGSYATRSVVNNTTVDGYFEVDLGQPQALYAVRAVCSDGMQSRTAHTWASLFDETHSLVLMQHLTGSSETFDIDLPGPVQARYVRIGLEYKERTSPSGGTEWLFGLKELQAFGRGTNEVGLLSFTATSTQIVASASTTLQWQESDLNQLHLYPSIGSVGSNTAIGGSGSLTQTPPVSIEYTLVGSNYNGNFIKQLAIIVNGTNLPARISEFVADNQFSLKDGDGGNPDWIELHNPNNTSLNLAGYRMSDDPLAPTKFTIPSGVIIPPHGYLMVFADDSDTPFDAAGYLHANFQLDPDTESILLIASNSMAVVDAITNYPAQTEDLAYGRTLDGQWTFLEPTPGLANVATTYDGWLAPIDFSHKRGWYTNSFTLTIVNSNASSQVYYSLDGTVPSFLYSGSLLISTTTPVRASVVRSGYKSPKVKTHTYLFLDDILASSVMSTTYTLDPNYTNRLRQGMMDLPTFCINVPPAGPAYNDERYEREASVEIFWPNDSDDPIQANCGITHFGGAFGSTNNGSGNPYAKRSYQLKFRARYGTDKLKAPLFAGFDHGILAQDTFDELDIHAGNHDMVSRGFYLSHRFAADTMLDLGSLNPHGRFIHFYINGVYWGMYDAHERLTDSMLSEYLGGPVSNYLTVKGNDNGPNSQFILGVPDPPDRLAWETVRSNRNSYVLVKDLLDVPNLIDFMIVWNWGNAESEYRAAGGRYTTNGGFKFWVADADGHLRQQSGVSGQLSRNFISGGTVVTGPGLLFTPLLTEGHPDFKTLLADRIYRALFNSGPMTPAADDTRMTLRMNEITNSMVDECARWGGLTGRTPTTWQSDAQYARDNLFAQRNAILLTQMRTAGWYPLLDAPVLSQFGGSVTNGYQLTISGLGTLYYTLDGSDPRLPGGGISTNALVYTGQTTNQPVSWSLGSVWSWRKGTNEASTPISAWRSNNFNASTWATNIAPFQYGLGGGTVLSDMRSNYTCVFIRRPFVVNNPAGITALRLSLSYDDGFVAWVNGTEITRGNVTANPVFHTNIASANHANTPVENFTNSAPQSFLVPGTNILAIQGFNRDLKTSTDFYLDLTFNMDVTNTAATPLVLTLTNDTTISVRVWDGSTWSALAQTTFVLAPLKQPELGDLMISEINYNPDGADDQEFIEIYNISTNLLDLTNVRLTDGLDFLFPNNYRLAPGSFTIVAENSAAFDARYRATNSLYYYPNLQVAGVWAGALNNGGERVALVASNNVELASVDYKTSNFWPSRADGKGSTIELRNPTAAAAVATNLNAHLNRGENWRSSRLYNGTPGRLDTDPKRIVINEALTHTDIGVDWVELLNVSGETFTFTNCYLSDHYTNLFRYAFPNTNLAPGAFMALNVTNLGFAFSELGTDIILSQSTGTNVVQFLDTVDVPAAQREEPFGRYTRSDGLVDFTELRSKTLGANNSLPRVGSVVVSEIMYHPTNGLAEYIELVNIGKTNVPLYDPPHNTNTWELADGIEFRFPASQQMASGAVIIVCATNPADFRAQYGVSTNIPVYGPWTNVLDNAGDGIRLRCPGDPETNGVVPYYRVDHIEYEPTAPWPTGADTGGVSLERATLEAYGNDPANWQASVAGGTPGAYLGNHLPIVNVGGSTTVMEGTAVALSVSATDPDQPWQNFFLSAQNLPVGSSFNTNTGDFTWNTVETNGPGVYALKFLATDSGVVPLVRTQTVNVTVTESNGPPLLQSVTSLQYPAQTPLIIDLVGTDPDLPAQPLTYGAVGLPTGLSLNPTTGRISGGAQNLGVYPISLTVSDNQLPPMVATNAFTLTVTEAFKILASSTNGPPKFKFWTIAGETYDVQYTYTLTPENWLLLLHIESAIGGLTNVPSLPNTNSPSGFVRVIWRR